MDDQPVLSPGFKWPLIALLTVVILLAFYAIDKQVRTQNQAPIVVQAAKMPLVSQATLPTVIAQPQLQPFRQNLLVGNYEVQRGNMLFWNFPVTDHMRYVSISGDFHAFGGRGNDIQLVIADAFNFENWKNGHTTMTYYSSGKVTNGAINVNGLPPGQYVIALDNRNSALSAKEVNAAIVISGYLAP